MFTSSCHSFFRSAVLIVIPLALSQLIPAMSPALSAEPAKVTTVEGITEYRLENGLRLLLFPDPSQSKVTVNMTVLVGSRHEGYGETGMAHLLEHLVFKGTPDHPNVPKVLQEHGAQFNGSTNGDRTNYFETLTASDANLEFAIRLEADRLVNSRVRKEDLDSEMTVVRNEFELGENSPLSVLGKRVSAAAFEWHNYGKSTIGNRSDIERVPIENLRAFYEKFYQPDNTVVIVAGQFHETKALELVQRYFGAIKRPVRRLDATYTEEPAQDGERIVTLRRVGTVGAVAAAYHIPAGSHADIAPLQVLSNVLDMRPSGRLYKSLVETKRAANVSAVARGEHDPGLMWIQATVTDFSLLDSVRDTILETVEQIGAAGVTAEEVGRARQQLITQRQLSATDTNSVAIALSGWVAQGDWRLYFLHRDRLEQVTPEQVVAVAKRYLQRNNRTVGIFVPSNQPERISIPAAGDVGELVADYRGRAPVAAGEAFDPTPENIESRVTRLVLPKEIQATLLPKKSRGEEVHLTLTLRYGNDQNLRGFQAASGFLGDLMLRGTKRLSDQQIRDELDRLQASISAGGGGGGRGRRGGSSESLGSVSFSVHAKRETLPAVLEILRQVLREPELPESEFEVMKRSRLAAAEQSRTDPAALASRWLQRTLTPYSKDDVRYVPTIEESIEQLQRADHSQVATLYREYLGAQAGELAIVGDFDNSTNLTLLQNTLTGWIAPQPYSRIATGQFASVAGTRHQINTPDKANATYLSGLVLMMRDDDPDYPALVMANYIFGGGSLSSRLGTRIRQQDGLSYGVGSSLTTSALDRFATLGTNAICNPANIGKVDQAMAEELQRILQDGFTEEELTQAKQGYLQARRVARASDATLAALLSAASHAGRTMKFHRDLEQKISELTARQVHDTLKKHVSATKFFIVTAGDFQAR